MNLDALKSEDDKSERAAHHLERAKADLKIWRILTSKQQKLAMEKATEHPHRSPVEYLSAFLNLSDTQKTTLESVFEANRPKHRDPVAFLTLLSSEKTTAADLAALHAPLDSDENHGPLKILSAIHSVLTAEQRQVFVDKGLSKMRGPHHRLRGPHAN